MRLPRCVVQDTFQRMRAVVISQFGGPSVLKVQNDVPIPDPKENQVLIKVEFAGVNPVETYIRQGAYSRLPELPFTPGGDAAGTVVKCGANVTKLKEGDRVFTAATASGSYAEYATALETRAWPLISRLSFQEGAALGVPYFTAYKALFSRANAKAGETVLVHGASGGVGLAACQIASSTGLSVLGTAGSLEGKAVVQKMGAQHVFNHREKGYTEQIKEATGGKGVDIILEMLANVNLNEDLELLGRHGRVVIIGSRGPIKIDPRMTMGKETSILGMALFQSSEETWEKIGIAMVKACEEGWVKPVIDKEYSLEEAGDAHTDVIKHGGGGARGKIILKTV